MRVVFVPLAVPPHRTVGQVRQPLGYRVEMSIDLGLQLLTLYTVVFLPRSVFTEKKRF